MGLLILGHVPRCPGGIGPDRDVVPASTNAIVPALSLGLPRLDTHATTHCSPAQAMAPLDFVGNHPDLVQWPHRHFAHIVGHVLPAGTLRVAGGDPCSVPQVPVFIQGIN